jgi:2-C-methyl-D-erythritol 4-phosphate cytidylyltransferase
MASFSVILVAAGQSRRFDHEVKKPYADIDGRAVWMRAADLFVKRKDVKQIILVVAADDEENVLRRYGPNMTFMNVTVTLGGATRADSVQNGLAKVSPDVDFVAIHDAARPCATDEMIDKVFEAAKAGQAAILAAPVVDTLKRGNGKLIERTEPRENLWLAQTPQVFRRDVIQPLYQQRDPNKAITDDASLAEAAGVSVTLVPSDNTNIKITTVSDLFLAGAIIKSRPKPKSKAFHPFADEDMWK